jgi:hypothetical protein
MEQIMSVKGTRGQISVLFSLGTKESLTFSPSAVDQTQGLAGVRQVLYH